MNGAAFGTSIAGAAIGAFKTYDKVQRIMLEVEEPDASGPLESRNIASKVLRYVYERDSAVVAACAGLRLVLMAPIVEHIVPKIFAYFDISKAGKAVQGSRYKSLLHKAGQPPGVPHLLQQEQGQHGGRDPLAACDDAPARSGARRGRRRVLGSAGTRQGPLAGSAQVGDYTEPRRIRFRGCDSPPLPLGHGRQVRDRVDRGDVEPHHGLRSHLARLRQLLRAHPVEATQGDGLAQISERRRP